MATTTSLNIYVAPEDGWVQVVAPASTINFIYAKAFPCPTGVYLYIGTSIPTEMTEPTGVLLQGHHFKMNVPTSAVGCWVRSRSPNFGGAAVTHTQKVRLDVIVTTA